MPTNPTGETGTADSAHVRAVRDYYACVDSGQISALVDLFADDAEYHRPGYEPIIGRNQLESFYREQRIIRDGRHTLTAIVASDDLVAVHGEFNGVLQDGSSTSVRFADFFRSRPTGSPAATPSSSHRWCKPGSSSWPLSTTTLTPGRTTSRSPT